MIWVSDCIPGLSILLAKQDPKLHNLHIALNFLTQPSCIATGLNKLITMTHYLLSDIWYKQKCTTITVMIIDQLPIPEWRPEWREALNGNVYYILFAFWLSVYLYQVTLNNASLLCLNNVTTVLAHLDWNLPLICCYSAI